MSRTTKKKHVRKELIDDFDGLAPNQQIVRVLNSRGNNLHQVQASDKSTFLASMPSKFRKNIWIKRGDFVVVDPIEEGDKVKAEMVRILTDDHIKQLKKDNLWPVEFSDKDNKKSDDSDENLFENTNRLNIKSDSDSERESSSGDSSEEE